MDTNDERQIAAPNAGGGANDQRQAERPREPFHPGRIGRRPEPPPTSSAPTGASGPTGQPNRGPGRRPGGPGGQSPAGEHRDERRRRDGKHGPERKSFVGFGDEVERAYCDAAVHLLPETFPVVHRQGAATRRIVTVATKSGAILLCDGAHTGPHRWPTGDEVADAAIASASSRLPTTAHEVDDIASDADVVHAATPAVGEHGGDDA